MTIVLAGVSGLIGTALVASLRAHGHRLVRLVRREAAGPDEVTWNPADGDLSREALEGVDAVINLAGEPIAAGRWTRAKKRLIRESRVHSTRLLAETLATFARPATTLINASAVGYYGNRGDEILTEESPPGRGFLAETCVAWEGATKPAEDAGIRVIHARFGLVLARHGGALQRLLPIFRMGVGGPLGRGRQFMSFVTLNDAVRALHRCLNDRRLRGPINIATDAPVINAEFAKSLGRALRRPALIPVPAIAARLALGELANQLLLASARVNPGALLATGFAFRHSTITDALAAALSDSGSISQRS